MTSPPAPGPARFGLAVLRTWTAALVASVAWLAALGDIAGAVVMAAYVTWQSAWLGGALAGVRRRGRHRAARRGYL